MAALFASMAVKRSLDNLSSLLPATTTSMPSAAVASSSSSSSISRQGLENLLTLERTMRQIDAMLQDAEQNWNLHEESAQLRLTELKDLAYDAEDVVEENEYEVNRCRVDALDQAAAVQVDASDRKRQKVYDENGIVAVPDELGLRARKVVERFSEIIYYSDSFSLSEKDGKRKTVPDIRSVRHTSSIVCATKILGRKKDKEAVIKMLVSGYREGSRASSHLSVLAIVGMGGLGKTTLAQLVYNDTSKVRQCFDLHAWVYVSEYFNVEIITRKIITSITQSSCHHIQDCALQGALAEQVKEKRVLLVLDDVWNEQSEYWDLLCMPLLASTQCDIIVTTRSKAVACLVQTMPFYSLNCLSPDDSWSLFKQTAFVQQEIATPAPNLVDIGTSITRKCNGLPLAIKTLGSTLRYETDATRWRYVLESELWDLKQPRNEVLPALELSYKYMPLHLRRCFVSLSLFPKHTYIDQYRVISLWKLLDLLQCDGSDTQDETGSLFFNELIQRSLLQHYVDQQNRVMHDTVHDLACFLAGEEFFRHEGSEAIEIPRDSRYVSIISGGDNKTIHISNASQSLRTIIVQGGNDFENTEALFSNCSKLRIIEIEKVSVAKVLLDFIGGMKLLRHFTLHAVPYKLVLPNSVFQLFNLRTLNFGEAMVQGIGRLVNLHTFPKIHFNRCSDSLFGIRQLRNMNKIRKLNMYGLCYVSTRDADEAHLHCKKDLEILELDFYRGGLHGTDSRVSSVQLLESLRPHHQSLKVLRLKNFNCEIYPSWLGISSFSILTMILLQNFQCKHLPPLGELPSLNFLDIRTMERVECIGQEFCSLNPRVKGFQTLKELKFFDMYQLSDWFGVEHGAFSRLETLWISSALELRSLPLAPFLPLRSLNLHNCRSLMTFPASAALCELSIVACATLNELPALPSLRSLELFNCPNLVTLGHFPSLSVLKLHGPFKEEVLYRLVNSHLSLESLSVWSDALMSIHLEPQSLPSLIELDLAGSNLQYCDQLGSLSSLKKLNVYCAPRFHVPDSLRTQLEKLIDPNPYNYGDSS